MNEIKVIYVFQDINSRKSVSCENSQKKHKFDPHDTLENFLTKLISEQSTQNKIHFNECCLFLKSYEGAVTGTWLYDWQVKMSSLNITPDVCNMSEL